jgi:hypothetical protein
MTTALTECYPKLIKDLFLYDIDSELKLPADLSLSQFFLRVHHANLKLPFEYNTDKLLEEAKALPYRDSYIKRCYTYGPKNQEDTRVETVFDKKIDCEFKLDLGAYPHTAQLMKNLMAIGPITRCNHKLMLPKTFISPHIDSTNTPFKIYMPLNWPDQCYYRFYKKGNLDLKPGVPAFINTGHNVHCVVNDSDEERYVLSFNVDWSATGWQALIKNYIKNIVSGE